MFLESIRGQRRAAASAVSLSALGTRVRDAAVAVWYVALTILSTAPILADPRGRVPAVPLDPLFQATVLERMSQNLLRLDLGHLWDGGFFFPAERTLAMSDSLLGLQPLALPLRLLLHDPILVANLLLVLTFPLAALSADALARCFTGSRLAGWICGTAYAFAAYRFTHVGHLNLLQMWALPLAFLTLELVLRRGDRRAAAAWAAVHVFVAGTALNYLLMLAILEPLWLLVRIALDRERRPLARRLTRLVVPGAVAAAVIALLLLPYVELRAEGFARRDIETFDFSARVTDYLRPTPDALLLGRAVPQALTGGYERAIGPGLTVLGLAVVGAAYGVWRGREAGDSWRRFAPWVALGAGAFVLSLGPRLWPDTHDLGGSLPSDYPLLPFGELDAVLPLESLRSPARFSVLVLLAVALAAGATVSRAWRSGTLQPRTQLRGALVAVVAVALVAEYAAQIPTVPAYAATDRAPVYEWLRRQPPGPVVELPTNAPDRYLLASTGDGHPRLNGWSGFVPPVSERLNLGLLRDGVTPEESADWVREAARLGARYLVVHWPDVTPRTRVVLGGHLRDGSIRPLAHFRGASVYEVWPFGSRPTAAAAQGTLDRVPLID